VTAGRFATGLAAALALVALAAPAAARLPVKVETIVRPDTVLIGQDLHLAWRVWLPKGATVSFPARPADDSLFHWSRWDVSTVTHGDGPVEHRLDVTAQSFALGPVAVPGPPLRFQVPGEDVRTGRFPTTGFVVGRTVPTTGPEPPLRGMKPLLPAPWWARVPWLWIVGGLVLTALIVWAVRALLLRRKPRPAGADADAAPEEAPEIVARRRLAALIARRLPEAGLTYEHGTELADLLRRFAERRFETPRPGFTTRELLRHLAGRPGVEPADLATLAGILEACDLTKFARRPYDADRAHAAEREAAQLIERWARPAPAAATGAEAAS